MLNSSTRFHTRLELGQYSISCSILDRQCTRLWNRLSATQRPPTQLTWKLPPDWDQIVNTRKFPERSVFLPTFLFCSLPDSALFAFVGSWFEREKPSCDSRKHLCDKTAGVGKVGGKIIWVWRRKQTASNHASYWLPRRWRSG